MSVSSDASPVERAGVVWRSSLRGVVILDERGQWHVLAGTEAAVWLALDEGPLTVAEICEQLRSWSIDAPRDAVDRAVSGLIGLTVAQC